MIHYSKQAFKFTKSSASQQQRQQPTTSPTTEPPPRKRAKPSPKTNTTTTTATSPVNNLVEKLGTAPLRLIIVGHNPSQKAWELGHYYANPSNWMWRILKDTGIAPPDLIRGCEDDALMPEKVGVGFTDVGFGTPGTDSSKFTAPHFDSWRQSFFDRLVEHVKRASESVGCRCGQCGAPVVVAFSGKKQFSDLFFSAAAAKKTTTAKKNNKTNAPIANSNDINTTATVNETNSVVLTTSDTAPTTTTKITVQASRPKTINTGRQDILPQGWPLSLQHTEVWVMSSTSGAAAMTREQRYRPWEELAQRVLKEPWPRSTCIVKCR